MAAHNPDIRSGHRSSWGRSGHRSSGWRRRSGLRIFQLLSIIGLSTGLLIRLIRIHSPEEKEISDCCSDVTTWYLVLWLPPVGGWWVKGGEWWVVSGEW